MHDSRSRHAVIRVYDGAGNVIETHEHAGEFKVVNLLPPAGAVAFCDWESEERIPGRALNFFDIKAGLVAVSYADNCKGFLPCESPKCYFIGNQLWPSYWR